MIRPSLFAAACFAAILLVAFADVQVSSAAELPQKNRPNIILCMADDQGWSEVAYNGHPLLQTPVLKEHGYATGHYGKWHLGPVKASAPNSPGNQGFDEWLSHDNYFELDPLLSRNGAPPTVIKGESSEIIVREAISFIRRAVKEDQPFFTVVWFGSCHGPHSVPPDAIPGAASPFGLWGALGTRASKETIEEQLNQ